jgi:hypothetical protein
MKATMIGIAALPDSIVGALGNAPQPATSESRAPLPQPADPRAAAPGAPAAGPPQRGGGLHQTMVGMPTPGAGMAPPAAAAPPPAMGGRPVNKTMLGVALPGIAPTGEAPPPMQPAPAPAPLPVAPAPVPRSTVALKVPYVPPPEPLADEPAPPPPRIVRRKGGIPLAAVGGVSAVLVLGLGAAIALLWRSAPPISAQPRSAPDGKDILHLSCDARSCADGTVVTFGGARATFATGEADLTLPEPLRIGDNALSLVIDRPGMGRDETVKVTVPVAYRVRADVSTMNSPRPAITIRVEAQPGTDVQVNGKPVTLDAAGVGAYAVDESASTEGPADESRVISVDVPYVVVQKGGTTEKGTASARVAVAPLRVDAPGTKAVVDDSSALLAGRAAKGSTVTVDGVPVTVGPDGAFETTVPLGSSGDHGIEVRAGTSVLAPRTVHALVTRATSLADAAKQFEQQHPIGYDAAMSDIAGKTGQPIVVTGEVLDARSSGHRTLALVDDKRGCAKGPCLARVVLGRDMPLAHGDVVSAYGLVARAFSAPGGQTVPEVEAQFLLRGKR